MSESNEALTLSARIFRYWIVDYENQQLTFKYQDGRTKSVDFGLSPSANTRRTILDWENWWLVSETNHDDQVLFELYSPSATDKGRPAIYLDQNHWSTLAWASVEPSRVSDPNELAAAQRLIALASDAKVILPLSFCHLLETSALYGKKRYEVGVTIARLSGGWLMRHPMTVLAQEVTQLVAQVLQVAPPPIVERPTITLEPFAYMPSALDVELTMNGKSDFELLREALTCPSVVLDMLIDSSAVAKADISNWITSNQDATAYFAATTLKQSERNDQALGMFWYRNVIGEVLTATEKLGLPRSRADEILTWSPKDVRPRIAALPFTSRFAQLFIYRYLNKSTKWKHNDLNDMSYLSCAAAASDYVVAEGHTGTQLKQFAVSRGDEQPAVFTKLSHLVTRLEEDGVYGEGGS